MEQFRANSIKLSHLAPLATDRGSPGIALQGLNINETILFSSAHLVKTNIVIQLVNGTFWAVFGFFYILGISRQAEVLGL